MKRHARQLVLVAVLAISSAFLTEVPAETETIDLKALAKKARPAVMLLVVSDASGKEIATGTGFLVSSDGKLITNHHVIENAASAVAKAENGGLFPVEGVLADDPKNDLVLLKVKGKDLPFLPLSTNATVEVGTRIAVIGSPLGLEGTLSEGIVSGVRELMADMRFLQVTAAISPGSSGSPVLNVKGEVVGVANSLLNGGQALNFAVPVEFADNLLAKVQPSTKPQTLGQLSSGGMDAIFSDPDFLAGAATEASGDDVEVLKNSKMLVGRYPENAVAHYLLGCAYANLKFDADAIAAYQQAIKLKPEFAEAWWGLGTEYARSQRVNDAIAAYQRAIKLKPDFAKAWYYLGLAYGISKREAEQIAAYRQAIKLQPKDADDCVHMGIKFLWSGLIDDAIAAYRQAIKLKPEDADTWNRLGVAYAESSRLDEAVAAYKQAIKLKPDFSAWYNLGDALFQAGRTNEAAAAFQRARELNPEQFKIREDMKK